MRDRAVAQASLYGAIEAVSTVDLVAQRLEHLILKRQLQPGETLPPERELAAQLAVSRNVLREALRTLAEKGLIQIVHGRGAFVREPSTEAIEASLSMLLRLRRVSLSDLCDARMLLEPEIAALAAQHAAQDDKESLLNRIAALEAAADDKQAHVEADLELHREIARVARHTVYEAITEAVRAPVTKSMLLGTGVPRAIDASDDHHRAIVDAIVNGDAERARSAMAEHIAFVAEYIRAREQLEDR